MRRPIVAALGAALLLPACSKSTSSNPSDGIAPTLTITQAVADTLGALGLRYPRAPRSVLSMRIP